MPFIIQSGKFLSDAVTIVNIEGNWVRAPSPVVLWSCSCFPEWEEVLKIDTFFLHSRVAKRPGTLVCTLHTEKLMAVSIDSIAGNIKDCAQLRCITYEGFAANVPSHRIESRSRLCCFSKSKNLPIANTGFTAGSWQRTRVLPPMGSLAIDP